MAAPPVMPGAATGPPAPGDGFLTGDGPTKVRRRLVSEPTPGPGGLNSCAGQVSPEFSMQFAILSAIWAASCRSAAASRAATAASGPGTCLQLTGHIMRSAEFTKSSEATLGAFSDFTPGAAPTPLLLAAPPSWLPFCFGPPIMFSTCVSSNRTGSGDRSAVAAGPGAAAASPAVTPAPTADALAAAAAAPPPPQPPRAGVGNAARTCSVVGTTNERRDAFGGDGLPRIASCMQLVSEVRPLRADADAAGT